ncbi:MAG: long-chain fatty acid--CoA ligase [Alphaproteobacteria bacterium]|nr:long-chain fatty acid--CoA ligase [Alphaproteobacteria bacterium]
MSSRSRYRRRSAAWPGKQPGVFSTAGVLERGGGRIVLPATPNADGAARAIANANLVLASPIDLERVLDQASHLLIPDPNRRTFVAGGRLSPRLSERICRHLGPEMTIMYGSAEAAWVCRGKAEVIDRAVGAVGRPLPRVEVEVVDDQDRLLPLGIEGRVRIKSPYVIMAHAKNGWFYPGDRGTVDSNRLLSIAGRIDDVINIGGAKLAPAPLEAALIDIAGVEDAAIVAVPSEDGSERLVVATVTPANANWRDIEILIGGVMRRGPPYLNVRVESLPRNQMGKLERRRLASYLSSVISAVDAARPS